MAMTLVLVHTLEILQHLVREVVLVIDILLQYVTYVVFERKRLGEMKCLSAAIVENGYTEYSLPMLRYAVVSRIHNLIEVSIAITLQL